MMISTIILAAGKGTRLKSQTPKVLHEVNGKPSLFHVIELANSVSNETVVVIGYKHETVKEHTASKYPSVKFALQIPQNGTADAVIKALPYLNKNTNAVIVLSGDAPALSEKSLKNLIEDFQKNNYQASFIASEVPNPAKYGRVIIENSKVKKIVEFIDADEEEKKIKLVNSGVYIFDINFLKSEINNVKQNDKNGEFYLPSLIETASLNNKAGVLIIDNYIEILGFNTQEQLKELNEYLKKE